MCEWCPGRPIVNDGIVTCSVCGETQTVLGHQGAALATCISLVKQGQSFTCDKVEDGWLFVFSNEAHG